MFVFIYFLHRQCHSPATNLGYLIACELAKPNFYSAQIIANKKEGPDSNFVLNQNKLDACKILFEGHTTQHTTLHYDERLNDITWD